MYLNDGVLLERLQPENEVTPIRQILAELLAERGLLAAAPDEVRAPTAPWRSVLAVSAAA